jgi:hypothetical protein
MNCPHLRECHPVCKPGAILMPFDVELAEAMRAALSCWRRVVEKKMFCGYCWMLNGNMLRVEVGRFVL